jgi:hypothetical protein
MRIALGSWVDEAVREAGRMVGLFDAAGHPVRGEASDAQIQIGARASDKIDEIRRSSPSLNCGLLSFSRPKSYLPSCCTHASTPLMHRHQWTL